MVTSYSTAITGTFRATYIINSDDGIFGKVFLAEVSWTGREVAGTREEPGETVIDDVTISRVIWHRDVFHVGTWLGVQAEPGQYGTQYTSFLNGVLLRDDSWASRLQDRAMAELRRAIETGRDDIHDVKRVEMDELVDLAAA